MGISQEDWKCLAYRIETKDRSVTVSGDAVDCRGLTAMAKNTDALVMCCYLSKKEQAGKEGDLIGKHILAGSSQAGKIAAKANAKKLILTHIREKKDETIKEVIDEVKADFIGKIIVGQDLMEICV